MIDKSEIMDFSREFGLAANVVEKDYTLGWVLAGIFQHPAIGNSWVFKGGTCLKKCFFETYRFSEDLDFTVPVADGFDQAALIATFKEISGWVYDATGIEIPVNLIRFDVYQNHRGGMSAQGRIGYRGPLQPRGDLPRIKIDLTTDELLALDPVVRAVHHPYSDAPDGGVHIASYCFEEVFAEKIRALAERQRPRDLYDVVHLYRHDNLALNQGLILDTLERKCAYKAIPTPTMETFRDRAARAELEAEWEHMLAHQLPALPPFNEFWKILPEMLTWLRGATVKAVQTAIPNGRIAVDETWRPPAMANAWHLEAPLERIRFAAANRLCVNLGYNNGYRVIEPYSLRRTQEGNILLYALRHETQGWRSYRVDRIQGVEITQTPFVPQHAIELTPTGPDVAPHFTRRSSSFSPLRTATRRQTLRNQIFEPVYVIECPVCGKKFNHKINNSKLNPHKDKNGYPCWGRSGYLVDTKY